MELEFTTDKPTKSGFYWYYPHGADRPVVAEVIRSIMHGNQLWLYSYGPVRAVADERPDTLWAGPIPPPTR